MTAKLPHWVEVGAFILALVAGFVNAVGLLSFEHQSVSHLSGTATLLGTSVLNSSFQHVLHLSGILLSFLFGAIIAGFLLHGSTLKLGRHYDTALYLESALLLTTLGLLAMGSFYGHFFASAACGLQNSLATRYSGAIIRTTHVTGIFTDLGIMCGEFLRGEALDKRKAKLFIIIIAGFIFGGTVGALLYTQYQFMSLLLPAGICLLLAIIYRFYCQNQAIEN
ncbi:YoaK family protein [Thalassotalea agariperforans]